jgi:DNA replication and repair protein RecF
LKTNPNDTGQLFVWSLRLSELADKIVKLRLETLEKINQKTSETYSKIAHKKSSLSLEYKTSVKADSNYSANLLKKLESNINEDRQRGFTVFGPHRDDFLVFLDGQQAANFASRGEVRTIILALKIIQLSLLEESTGKRPLFLLDDVFSELDGARRRALTNYLKDYQAVITTTDADIIMKSFSQKAQIIALPN